MHKHGWERKIPWFDRDLGSMGGVRPGYALAPWRDCGYCVYWGLAYRVGPGERVWTDMLHMTNKLTHLCVYYTQNLS